jgi:hypothetical protein
MLQGALPQVQPESGKSRRLGGKLFRRLGRKFPDFYRNQQPFCGKEPHSHENHGLRTLRKRSRADDRVVQYVQDAGRLVYEYHSEGARYSYGL